MTGKNSYTFVDPCHVLEVRTILKPKHLWAVIRFLWSHREGKINLIARKSSFEPARYEFGTTLYAPETKAF